MKKILLVMMLLSAQAKGQSKLLINTGEVIQTKGHASLSMLTFNPTIKSTAGKKLDFRAGRIDLNERHLLKVTLKIDTFDIVVYVPKIDSITVNGNRLHAEIIPPK